MIMRADEQADSVAVGPTPSALKTCTRCLRALPCSDFSRRASGSPDGLRADCRECQKTAHTRCVRRWKRRSKRLAGTVIVPERRHKSKPVVGWTAEDRLALMRALAHVSHIELAASAQTTRMTLWRFETMHSAGVTTGGECEVAERVRAVVATVLAAADAKAAADLERARKSAVADRGPFASPRRLGASAGARA